MSSPFIKLIKDTVGWPTRMRSPAYQRIKSSHQIGGYLVMRALTSVLGSLSSAGSDHTSPPLLHISASFFFSVSSLPLLDGVE